MEIAYAVIFALFGAVIGSFLNVLCDRLPQEQSVVAPPSRCPGCGRRLTPLDMIPVISWLALRGRCRTCGEQIPQRVFWVELVTALAFAGLYLYFGFSAVLWLSLVYAAFTIVIFVIDMEHQLILNGILIAASIVALAASVFHSQIDLSPNLLHAVIGGVVGFLIFLVVYVVSRGGMGEGDVKLGAFAGLVTGWPNIIAAVIMSWILGGIIAIGLLIFSRKGRKEAIPFGPFLALTTFITFLWGNQIIDWYLGVFTR
ncbi:leader peptidase (prepilin peptidase) / N-methyltransferase [Dehalogenimonas formicexedens]|uniref:Leader peptidase (Prepilin peptidase) / N-methyltransferase n=1 Tax=Dehalogenimonas formicexedens TaxID=1839801 RepID=A0A1P8F840_9CHLR|nr:A24 family peptidase [Dehalogenimonas formicexedens]APV44615.1 leader peptidase (prepilin peptidase) / N-methyltransferase [Dehalogenimonas formicexedens]